MTDMQKVTVTEIVSLFEQLERGRESSFCTGMFCSTCGGLAKYIECNLTVEEFRKLNFVLDEISPSDLYGFGRWEELVATLSPVKYQKLIMYRVATARDGLNLEDPGAVDRFLFRAWKDKVLKSGKYQDVIDIGIALAVKQESLSLTETLILILGKQANKYPSLVKKAISLARGNEQLKRVLYNMLREEVEQVRDYRGDGSTVIPW